MIRSEFIISRANAKGIRPVFKADGYRLMGHLSKPWGRRVQAWSFRPLNGAWGPVKDTAREAVVSGV